MHIGLYPLGYNNLRTFFFIDQDRYDTPVVSKYLDTDTIKENSNFHKTTLPNDMILTK